MAALRERLIACRSDRLIFNVDMACSNGIPVFFIWALTAASEPPPLKAGI